MTATHLQNIHIQNFRTFENLSIPEFAPINLIVGANNTGKTGLLEAIYWLCNSKSDKNYSFHDIFRYSENDSKELDWEKWITHNHDHGCSIVGNMHKSTYCIIKNGINVIYLINNVNSGFHTADVLAIPAFIQSMTQAGLTISEVIYDTESESRLERLLKAADDRINSVRIAIGKDDKTKVFPIVGINGVKERVPSYFLGQGIARLLRIYGEILNTDKQIIIIDEIETGLHHSALVQLWRGIKELSKLKNVQVFATTHSDDCIRAACEVFSEEDEPLLKIHRLQYIEDKLQAFSFKASKVANALAAGLEVR